MTMMKLEWRESSAKISERQKKNEYICKQNLINKDINIIIILFEERKIKKNSINFVC